MCIQFKVLRESRKNSVKHVFLTTFPLNLGIAIPLKQSVFVFLFFCFFFPQKRGGRNPEFSDSDCKKLSPIIKLYHYFLFCLITTENVISIILSHFQPISTITISTFFLH